MKFPTTLLLFTTLAATTLGHNTPNPTTRVLYQYPNETRIENLAIRSNGHILLTLLTSPTLQVLNPFAATPIPSPIHTFPNTSTLFGIAELEPDIFAVATGNLSTTFAFPPNSFAIWLVDFRPRSGPQVTKAADLPAGSLVNGLARLSKRKVLGSDIGAGVLYAIDVLTGETSVAIADETMQFPPTLPGYGINGIRTHGGYLYYVNTGKGLFCRVAIHPGTGSATGPVEIISDSPAVVGGDDFALSKDGKKAYLANVFEHELLEVGAGGNVREIVSAEDGVLLGPTSAQLARTGRHRGVIYVVDSGSVFNPSTGGFDSVRGGRVVAVKLRG